MESGQKENCETSGSLWLLSGFRRSTPAAKRLFEVDLADCKLFLKTCFKLFKNMLANWAVCLRFPRMVGMGKLRLVQITTSYTVPARATRRTAVVISPILRTGSSTLSAILLENAARGTNN
jgi:hypothetical protein